MSRIPFFVDSETHDSIMCIMNTIGLQKKIILPDYVIVVHFTILFVIEGLEGDFDKDIKYK